MNAYNAVTLHNVLTVDILPVEAVRGGVYYSRLHVIPKSGDEMEIYLFGDSVDAVTPKLWTKPVPNSEKETPT